MMGPIGCPNTSVTNYQSTLHNNAEEGRISCMWLSKRQQLQLKDVIEEMATWRKCWKGYVFGRYDGRVELKTYRVDRRKTKELGLVWVSVL